jgi:hypothetical protein
MKRLLILISGSFMTINILILISLFKHAMENGTWYMQNELALLVVNSIFCTSLAFVMIYSFDKE